MNVSDVSFQDNVLPLKEKVEKRKLRYTRTAKICPDTVILLNYTTTQLSSYKTSSFATVFLL